MSSSAREEAIKRSREDMERRRAERSKMLEEKARRDRESSPTNEHYTKVPIRNAWTGSPGNFDKERAEADRINAYRNRDVDVAARDAKREEDQKLIDARWDQRVREGMEQLAERNRQFEKEEAERISSGGSIYGYGQGGSGSIYGFTGGISRGGGSSSGS